MVKLIAYVFKKTPEKGLIALLIGISIFIASVPFSLVFVIVKFNSFNFKNNNTEINLKGHELKKINQERVNKLKEENKNKDQKIEELIEAVKLQNVDKTLDETLEDKIENVEEAQIKTDIRLDDVDQSQEKLSNFVNSAIAEQ